jgi:uncharacterized membrane protein YbhN (UPF0104 family)
VPQAGLMTGTAPRRTGRRTPSALRAVLGMAVLVAAVLYLATVVEMPELGAAASALVTDPLGLAAALACYAVAFVLRARAWSATLHGLSFGQSWAAVHVSLAGNHVLPFRLGEALRVTSVQRRTSLATRPVVASAIAMRAADLVAVLALALLAVPGLVLGLAGKWVWLILPLLAGVLIASLGWIRRLRRSGAAVRTPLPHVAAAALAAWVLESAVVWQVSNSAGLELTFFQAVAITAVTIAAQTVALTPGGIGSYEAAATAALVALGADPGQAFAVALVTHAVKTAYAVLVGGAALFVPAPSYFGHLRLPHALPTRPTSTPVAPDAPVVAILPAHNEAGTVGAVVARLPATVAGRRLVTLVVDDGSTDDSAARAAAAGATVLRQPGNLGLGAAVRRGLAEAVTYRPAAVVYLDADGEYFPEDVEAMAAPVLAGTADYVVGSRFAGTIGRMLPQRRFGNRVLTAWVRWLTRRADLTDGQSGFRAFSPGAAADAEVIHDYNYAQVLTLDLLAKGYRYAEVPIRYSFREQGASFIRLGRYLRRVVPAVHRELNAPTPD